MPRSSHAIDRGSSRTRARNEEYRQARAQRCPRPHGLPDTIGSRSAWHGVGGKATPSSECVAPAHRSVQRPGIRDRVRLDLLRRTSSTSNAIVWKNETPLTRRCWTEIPGHGSRPSLCRLAGVAPCRAMSRSCGPTPATGRPCAPSPTSTGSVQVMHLAARVGVAESISERGEFHSVNATAMSSLAPR